MIIETHNLTKYYGTKRGCENICLSVEEGQVFGFLGPNGAGKSTLVKTLVGLNHPTSGEAYLLGKPLGNLAARRKIGFLPENFRYQSWLTGEELLSFHASLHGLKGPAQKRRIAEVLATVGMQGQEKYKVGTYSKGMQQRIGLAIALLPDPDLLFLDEPTSALDPVGRKDVREIILNLRSRGNTVFLNSHLLSEVEQISDRIAIIKNGLIIYQGDPDMIAGHKINLKITMDGFNELIFQQLQAVGFVYKVSVQALEVQLKDKEQIPRVAEIIVQNGGRLYNLTTQEHNLEQSFINLVGGENDV